MYDFDVSARHITLSFLLPPVPFCLLDQVVVLSSARMMRQPVLILIVPPGASQDVLHSQVVDEALRVVLQRAMERVHGALQSGMREGCVRTRAVIPEHQPYQGAILGVRMIDVYWSL